MRPMSSSLRVVVAVSLAVVPLVAAQGSRWRQIGTTTTGNPVFVDPRSISTKDGIVTATVRVTFVTPTPTPQGPITASRATAMFKCATKQVAVKENIIYHDEAKGTIYRRSVPQQPGFGPVFRSNFSGVALDHLCAAPPAAPKAPPTAAPKASPPAAPAVTYLITM
jgi:hypothetical protein